MTKNIVMLMVFSGILGSSFAVDSKDSSGFEAETIKTLHAENQVLKEKVRKLTEENDQLKKQIRLSQEIDMNKPINRSLED